MMALPYTRRSAVREYFNNYDHRAWRSEQKRLKAREKRNRLRRAKRLNIGNQFRARGAA